MLIPFLKQVNLDTFLNVYCFKKLKINFLQVNNIATNYW
jgi:hypothetical protein